MRLRTILLLTIFIFVCIVSGYAQPQHTRLLYSDPLDDGNSTDIGIMVNNGGNYLPGKGWEATTAKSQLKITLPADLPFEGTLAVNVTNFDPVSQNVDGIKQHIINLYSQENGNKDIFDTDGSWFNIRTGTAYSDGPGMAGFKFLAAARGIDSRDEERCMQWATWDADRVYEFKVIWTKETIYVLMDGVVRSQLPFHGQVEPFRYVFLGKDNILYGYGAQPGVIFSNLRIYSSDEIPENASFNFTDITTQANAPGLSDQGFGKGVSFADVNNDSLIDLFVTNAQGDVSHPDLLYMNLNNSLFQEQAQTRGTQDAGLSHGVVSADFDNDGDLDVFFANMPSGNGSIAGSNALYLNDSSGQFTKLADWSDHAGDSKKTISAIALDVDNDGDLDLYTVNWGAPNELYINNGAGKMTLEQRGAEGPADDTSEKVGVTAADVDRDGDIDIYVCRRDAANWLFINNGDGTFSEQAATRGVAVGGRSHGAVFADVDNDGDLDLFVMNYAYQTNELPALNMFLNQGDGTFQDVSQDLNINVSGYSLVLADVDNDADIDLYVVGNDSKEPGARPAMYLNDGSGQFTPVTVAGLEVAAKDARGTACADIDNDGDLDYYIACSDGHNYLLRNDLDSGAHYIDVLCIGPKGDYGGFGSKVSVYQPGHLGDANYLIGYQESVSNFGYISQNQTALHFGLADRSSCDIRVELTDGTVLDYTDVAADQVFKVQALPSFKMKYISGNLQSGYISTQLDQPLVVQVTDATDVPQADVPVSFAITKGGGQIVESQPVLTDSDGLAGVTLLLGNQADTTVVSASVNNAEGSPVEFQAIAILPPVHLVKESGDNQSAIVGQPLNNPIVVKTVYATGPAVGDYAVTFTIKSGGGNIQGDSSRTVRTDAAGLASVQWTLGTTASRQTLLASTADTSIEFSAIANPADPDTLLKISGDNQNYAPGQTFADPFMIKVTDQYGNAIANHSVRFRVVSGGGHIQGASEVEIATDSLGGASVVWTPGPYLGPANTLQAQSTWHSQALKGSPVEWTFPGISVDAAQSSITATSPVIADGKDSCEIVVSLKNNNGTAVGAGLSVQLNVSGTENRIVMNDTLTNDQGRVIAYLSSTRAETKVIRALVKGLDLLLADSAVVIFNEPPAVPDSLVYVSGDKQSGTVGQPLPSPFVVQVLDQYGNPLPDQSVTFSIVKGKGSFAGQQTLSTQTDSSGRASAILMLGTEAYSLCIVQAIVPNTNLTPITFSATAVPGPGAQMKIASGNNQKGCNNQQLASPFVVEIVDQYDNPVPNESVLFQVILGSGTFDGEDSLRVMTDTLGLASAFFTLEAKGDSFSIRASTDFAAVLFTVQAICAGVSDSLSTITATSPVFPNGLDQSKISITINDQYGNPISGVTIHLEASGNGNILIQPSAPTDSNGVAVGYLSSTVAEEKVVRAFVLPDSIWLQQQAHITFSYGQLKLEEISGNHQTGIVGQPLLSPFVVRIVSDSTSVANYPVRFKVLEGEGSFPPTQQGEIEIKTDSLGLAQTVFVLGAKIGTNKVQVTAENAENSPLFFFALGETCCQDTLIKVAGDSQVVKPGRTLPEKLIVRMIDKFDNPVVDQPVTFDAVDGGKVLSLQPVLTDSGGFAACSVAVGVEERIYTFTAKTEDNVTVTFTAKASARDANHAPAIVTFKPDSLHVIGYYGEPIVFEIVTATDADDDSLHYTWKMNGVVIAQDRSFSLIPNKTWPISNLITGIVSDGIAADSVVWQLQVLPTKVSDPAMQMPDTYALHQNYPNPFNPSTEIRFELPSATFVRLTVHNIHGQMVKTLVSGMMQAGVHNITWNARDFSGNAVPSGIYYYTLRTKAFVQTRKLILIK